LKSLKSKNIKSIQWFGVFPKNLKLNKRPIKLLDKYDLIVSTANLLPFFPKTPNKFIETFPVYKKYSSINFSGKYDYDIVFIGSLSKIHSNRWDVIEHIYNNFENFGVFGYGIDDVPNIYKFKENFKGSLWGEDYYRVIRNSKIVINLFLNDFKNLDSGLNLRIVEVIGNKSFLLTQYVKTLTRNFEINTEIAVFYNLVDLERKINFYLKNEDERTKVIRKGFQKVKKFTYENQIIDILNNV
jgi:spore maturation protein CgeB